MAEEKKGGMTVAEAGRKGGVKVAQERGRAFYEQIGKKGGETVKAERGHEFYEKIGKKGGESVRASRGPEFYSQIGHKGGQKVRELIEQGKRLGKANAAAAAKAPEIAESSSDDRAPMGSGGLNVGRGEE
ncbi:MAG: general stress protein B [Deltaproteobacteria bacterium]|nr:MAG: general stress protein B [Deltaproteobacteria bacterium]